MFKLEDFGKKEFVSRCVNLSLSLNYGRLIDAFEQEGRIFTEEDLIRIKAAVKESRLDLRSVIDSIAKDD